MNDMPICGRCYDMDNDLELFEAPCQEKPELLVNVPIGMYHCPDCGAMLIAAMKHPTICKNCLDGL